MYLFSANKKYTSFHYYYWIIVVTLWNDVVRFRAPTKFIVSMVIKLVSAIIFRYPTITRGIVMSWIMKLWFVSSIFAALAGFCDGIESEFCKKEFTSLGRHRWRCKARVNTDSIDLIDLLVYIMSILSTTVLNYNDAKFIDPLGHLMSILPITVLNYIYIIMMPI